jgi:hypothetical protein
MQSGVSERLIRLRALAACLDTAPHSPERDALLRDTRARITDLEVGAHESTAWSRSSSPKDTVPYLP